MHYDDLLVYLLKKQCIAPFFSSLEKSNFSLNYTSFLSQSWIYAWVRNPSSNITTSGDYHWKNVSFILFPFHFSDNYMIFSAKCGAELHEGFFSILPLISTITMQSRSYSLFKGHRKYQRSQMRNARRICIWINPEISGSKWLISREAGREPTGACTHIFLSVVIWKVIIRYVYIQLANYFFYFRYTPQSVLPVC